jgi:hypothetical protein
MQGVGKHVGVGRTYRRVSVSGYGRLGVMPDIPTVLVIFLVLDRLPVLTEQYADTLPVPYPSVGSSSR